MILPVCFKNYRQDHLTQILSPSDYHSVECIDVNKLLPSKVVPPREGLVKLCRSYFAQADVNEKDKLDILEELPQKWEIHGDLVLLPRESLQNAFWDARDIEFWRSMASGKQNDILTLFSIQVFSCTSIVQGGRER
jgi:hypothetical protein